MKAKKVIIDAAEADGTLRRVGRLISAAQILVCVANGFYEESTELLAEKGMLMGKIKKEFNGYTRAADRYFEEFALMVNEREKMSMFRDMDMIEEKIRAWALSEAKEL